MFFRRNSHFFWANDFHPPPWKKMARTPMQTVITTDRITFKRQASQAVKSS